MCRRLSFVCLPEVSGSGVAKRFGETMARRMQEEQAAAQEKKQGNSQAEAVARERAEELKKEEERLEEEELQAQKEQDENDERRRKAEEFLQLEDELLAEKELLLAQAREQEMLAQGKEEEALKELSTAQVKDGEIVCNEAQKQQHTQKASALETAALAALAMAAALELLANALACNPFTAGAAAGLRSAAAALRGVYRALHTACLAEKAMAGDKQALAELAKEGKKEAQAKQAECEASARQHNATGTTLAETADNKNASASEAKHAAANLA